MADLYDGKVEDLQGDFGVIAEILDEERANEFLYRKSLATSWQERFDQAREEASGYGDEV